MKTTNIELAKNINGSPLNESQIKLGLLVNFPSPVGGTITHKCTALNSNEATFESTNKDWPVEFVVKFNQPDLTLEEFILLKKALATYSKWALQPTAEQRVLVIKAQELGYALSQSHTQAHWTDKGLDACKSAMNIG